MWVARNRDGELRVFEMPPRRFHIGSSLPYKKTGFNDAVYIDDGTEDICSFWAIQKYQNSNYIDDKKSYGIRLFYPKDENIWSLYEPEWAKTLRWEDEPVEVICYPKY